MKLGAYLDEWFATARQSLRPTTAHGYQQAIIRLQGRLGPYRLQALTPIQVQRCYTELLETGSRSGGTLAPATLHMAHEVLRRYPVLLARFAAGHVRSAVDAARDGIRTARAELRDVVPPEAVEAAIAAYEREGRRLVTTGRQIGLVDAALRGERHVPRL